MEDGEKREEVNIGRWRAERKRQKIARTEKKNMRNEEREQA